LSFIFPLIHSDVSHNIHVALDLLHQVVAARNACSKNENHPIFTIAFPVLLQIVNQKGHFLDDSNCWLLKKVLKLYFTGIQVNLICPLSLGLCIIYIAVRLSVRSAKERVI
jgi:hypothetical protein